MTKILNTWKSTTDKKEYYELNKPIYTNGDWAVYRQFKDSFIYTFKNIAVNNLVGLNKEHIDRLANNQRPAGGSDRFIFDRAMEILAVGLSLL